MEFHPFAEDYPLMPAYELGRMEQGMRDRGFDPRFPIVRYQKKILDGRNRFLAAKAAGVTPLFVDFKGDDAAARLFVMTANEERRHLAPEWLERRRRERVERVAAAKVEGKSERAIAGEERVSRAQVRADLETARGQGVPTSPPDGKVTDSLGRQQPAARPPAIIAPLQQLIDAGGISPKLIPDIAALTPNQQGVVLEAVRGGANPRKAIRTAAAPPAREPGDEPPATRPPANGRVLFDNRKVTDGIGKLARLFSDRAEALKLQRSAGYAAVRAATNDLIAAWDRWQKESA